MYYVIWGTEKYSDCIGCKTLELAKQSCFAIIAGWIDEFWDDNRDSEHNKELLNEWNSMIKNCWVTVEIEHDNGSFETIWNPSETELRKINWYVLDKFPI